MRHKYFGEMAKRGRPRRDSRSAQIVKKKEETQLLLKPFREHAGLKLNKKKVHGIGSNLVKVLCVGREYRKIWLTPLKLVYEVV